MKPTNSEKKPTLREKRKPNGGDGGGKWLSLSSGKLVVTVSCVLISAAFIGILVMSDEDPFEFSSGDDDDEYGEFLSGSTINLSQTGVRPPGVNFGSSTFTFTAATSGESYLIIQDGTANISTRNITIQAGVTVDMTFRDLNFTGNVTLENGATLNLHLEGSTTILGSILVTTNRTLTIDSATTPGSEEGSLRVTPNAQGNAGIGGAGGSPGQAAGNIVIEGGTVITHARTDTGTFAGGAGIGGGGATSNNSAGGHGGSITINGGHVTAIGSVGSSENRGSGAGIGGGGARGSGVGGAGGDITINGGTVIATGGNGGTGGNSGAGIGGGGGTNTGGAGGTVTILNGKVTATGGAVAAGQGGAGIGAGGGGTPAGAIINFGASADIYAQSHGVRPAIHIAEIHPAGTGFFVNVQSLSYPTALTLEIYSDQDGNDLLGTRELLRNCMNFAFQLPGSTGSETYFVYIKQIDGWLMRHEDNSREIYSINARDGYDAHNNNANNGVLPVTFRGAIEINLSALTANITDGLGWSFSGSATSGTLTFNTASEGNIYIITQSGNPRNISITFGNNVNTTVILNGINITGNITLNNGSDVTLLLSDDNTILGSIFVRANQTLTIDSASSTEISPGISSGSTEGKLTVTPNADGDAAIGGAGNNTGENAGTITINGGTVETIARTETGTFAGGAGIGGGGATSNNSAGGHGGNITINGGHVTAIGSVGSSENRGSGAGIGGGGARGSGVGGAGGDITINGGTVIATGGTVTETGNSGAGIGGGGGSNTGGAGGTVTINGGNVTATGGTVTTGNSGAGIGGGGSGTGGNGGAVTILNGKVTATGGSVTTGQGGAGIGAGGGGTAAGAIINFGASAEIYAQSHGVRPAIHIAEIHPAGTGFFVNVQSLSYPSSLILEVLHSDQGGHVPLTSLELRANYMNFAFQLPGSTGSETYFVYIKQIDGWLMRHEDNSREIYSINARDGYDAHNNNANNGVLPVTFRGAIEINLTDLNANVNGLGWAFSGNAAGGTLTFNTAAEGNIYIITQSGNPRSINITFGNNVNATVILNGINITGNITLDGNADVTLRLSGDNEIRGSIFVRTNQTLTIDSASSPGTGSTEGSLTIITQVAGNAAIGGAGASAGQNAGTIIIEGGTINAESRASGSAGGAGIGGGGGTGNNGAGGHGGSITINGGHVTATGGNGTTTTGAGNGGAGIGGGGARGTGAGGAGSEPGGSITINGGTVIAIGGAGISASHGGAGIGAGASGTGAGGSGGTVTILNGKVTAIGGNVATGVAGAGIGAGGAGGAAGTGATIKFDAGAEIYAFSHGARPAIHIAEIHPDSAGFFVNVQSLSYPSSLNLEIYSDQDGNDLLGTLELRANYRNFAFQLPGSTGSETYFVYIKQIDGWLTHSNGLSREIYSINVLNGYNAHNNDANNGVLPVTFTGTHTIDLTSLTVAVTNGFGWGYTIAASGTLTFNTAAEGNIYIITQSGPARGINITFDSNVNTTVILNGINITGNITLNTGSDTTLLLNGTNINGNIALNGTSQTSILLDNHNTINGSILVRANQTLTIDSASSPGTGSIEGSLTVRVTVSGNAAIGGAGAAIGQDAGTIIINGGTINAESWASGSAGGAGIGGGGANTGNNGAGGHGGSITINGGRVTATGGDGATTVAAGNGGAGIGGGGARGTGAGGAGSAPGGSITINGGHVTATGGGGSGSITSGAGIGGGGSGAGIGGAGGTVTISNDSEVISTGGSAGNSGAGIGGGGSGGANPGGAGGTVTISNDSEVTATGGGAAGNSGAGIGAGGAGGTGAGGAGGTVTISNDSEVTATGGNVTGTGNSGAGIGGGGGGGTNPGGAGGTVTILNESKVTATGGSVTTGGAGAGIGAGGNGGTGAGTGATIKFDAGAEIYAFSHGARPAIHIAEIHPDSTGFFVNVQSLPYPSSLNLEIYSDQHGNDLLKTLELRANYRNFAFQFPDSTESETYYIHIKELNAWLTHSNGLSREIYSINVLNGYNAHNNNANNGVLPVTFTGVHTIDLTNLIAVENGFGWSYTLAGVGLLTFNTVANGNTYNITQSGPARGISITFGDNVNTTVNLNGVNITGNITLNTGSDTTLLLNGTNINGNIALNGTSQTSILLDNHNTINGSILVRANQTLTIDSASSPGTGSTEGSLTVTAQVSGNAAIGGAGGNPGQAAGTIIINGGTIEATGHGDVNNMAGGAGIGGGSSGGNGGSITINGGRVTAIGGNGIGTASANGGGAGIGGGGGVSSTAGGAGSAPGGSITIDGATVTAIGGAGISMSHSGAGIGGGGGGTTLGGGGGTVTILNESKVTATGGAVAAGQGGAGIGAGGGGTPAGATIKFDAGAEIYAFSHGARPAIHTNAFNADSAGFFVNVQSSSFYSSPTTLDIYSAIGNNLIETFELRANYRNFAFQFPDSTESETYYIHIREPDVWVMRIGDLSREIYSINLRNGYDAHNNNANNGVLPVVFPMTYYIDLTDLTAAESGFGWQYTDLEGGTLSFTVEANGHIYNIIQSGDNRHLGITISNLVATVNLTDIDITGNITLSDNSNIILLLSGYNAISGSILVRAGQTLTIDCALSTSESPGSTEGSLTVTAQASGNAAIGGATGVPGQAAGTIIINGGTINATGSVHAASGGGSGAGIGGGGTTGNGNVGGAGGNITINGGHVTATGGNEATPDGGSGAGIGGGGGRGHASGGAGGNITINGGTVIAIGGSNESNGGAGIGGGGTGIGVAWTAGAAGGAGGTITINGGTVSAYGGNATTGTSGAGIGGGGTGGGSGGMTAIGITGGAGGIVTILNGNVTAIGGEFTKSFGEGPPRGFGGAGIGGGGGGTPTGATINFGPDAKIFALTEDIVRPAVHTIAFSEESTGFFVNVQSLSFYENPLTFGIYSDQGGSIPLKTFTLPAFSRSFAFQFPGSTGSEIYYIHIAEYDVWMARTADQSREIYPINTRDGYSAHSTVINGVLSTVFSLTFIIDITELDGLTLDRHRFGYHYSVAGYGTLTFNTFANGHIFIIIQPGGPRNIGIVFNSNVTTTAHLNGESGAYFNGVYLNNIDITGNMTLNNNSDVTILLSGDNTILGSILVRPTQTLRIDSASSTPSSPGSTEGSLTVTAQASGNAAIGGATGIPGQAAGTIIINGGTINATGSVHAASGGGSGAGIGGGGTTGNGNYGGAGGNITINGGHVTARGGNGATDDGGSGAGIGGGGGRGHAPGGDGGTITINGGTVIAIGGSNESNGGAGIGGGGTGIGAAWAAGAAGGAGGTITINGGTVSAYGGNATTGTSGAGIGGGGTGGGSGNILTAALTGGEGGTITILDGNVTATGGSFTIGFGGAGIGAGGGVHGTGAEFTLGADAELYAFSYGGNSRPAIHAYSVSGEGFFVNAVLNVPVGHVLEVFDENKENLIKELDLSERYTGFAFSTGGSSAGHQLFMDDRRLVHSVGNDSFKIIRSLNENEIQQLWFGLTVTGTVTLFDGRPLEDVSIAFITTGVSTPVRTDAYGQYEIVIRYDTPVNIINVTLHGYMLAPADPAQVPRDLGTLTNDLSGIDFTMTYDRSVHFTITGTVTVETIPLEGVEISFDVDGDPSPEPAVTDENGRYIISVPSGSRVVITNVSLDGFIWQTGNLPQMSFYMVRDYEDIDFVMSFDPNWEFTISGTVRFGTNPLDNVEIVYNIGQTRGTVRTDENGQYVIHAHAGSTVTITSVARGGFILEDDSVLPMSFFMIRSHEDADFAMTVDPDFRFTITGTVTFDSVPMENVRISYNVDGIPADVIRTNAFGEYTIYAMPGDTITITSVRTNAHTATETLPQIFFMSMSYYNVDFTLEYDTNMLTIMGTVTFNADPIPLPLNFAIIKCEIHGTMIVVLSADSLVLFLERFDTFSEVHSVTIVWYAIVSDP